MYSVEDLLISHGYKVSRAPPAPREGEEHKRGLPKTRAGQRVLNGYENHPATLAQGKKPLGQGYAGESESRRGAPGSHRELQSSSASRTSETGCSKNAIFPPNCAPTLESTRNPEKGGSFVPFPRPKFGRPLKPPPYESHRQPKGETDSSDRQESQHTDLLASCSARTSEPRHELWASDAGVEPPVYVPPPSYRSPPQHITNPYEEDTVPQQPHPMERTSASHQGPCGSLGTRTEYGTSRRSPQGPPIPSRPAPAHNSSVQYIPFDDPRIRHIQLAQPQGFWEGEKLHRDPPASPEPAACGHGQHGGAFGDRQVPASGSKGAPGVSDPSPLWLRGHLLRDRDNDDNCVVREPQADVKGGRHGHPEGHISSPIPQGEGTGETITKLKMFETGSQVKRRSKKKLNETIFCLVSIPVKSESHLPDTDRNNNDLKQSADKKNGFDKSAALQEQSLLSMSSTDLELQALTGSMAGKTELQNTIWEPGDKERNDLRFIHPPGHRELKSPGSWPGHQHRDQQTQTSFAEEPKSSPALPGLQPGGSRNAVPTPKHSDPTASEAQRPPVFAPGDPKQRPSTHHLRGQMHLSLSSNSAFSRTPSCTNWAPVPRTCPGQPHGHAADPTPKGEVVKGEAAGPCNSKQFFGQFLLKPVSRRPWDLISQLESFNKELQEEEESSSGSSSGEESEAEWQQESYTDSRAENSELSENEQDMRVEQGQRTVVPEEPGFRSGRVKSKSESWSEEQKLGHPCAWPRSPGPWRADGSRGGCSGSGEGSLTMEKRIQEIESRIDQLAVSPGPVKRMMSFRLGDIKPAPPLCPVGPKEPQEGQKLPSVLSAVKLSQGRSPGVAAAEEQVAGAPLCLASKGRGLSAPDLRAVGLHAGQEQSASEPDGPLEEASAIEIPPHESLQARAARILGIDVAVESLLPGSSRRGATSTPRPVRVPRGQPCPGRGRSPRSVPRRARRVPRCLPQQEEVRLDREPPLRRGRDGDSRAPQACEPGRPCSPEPQPSPLDAGSLAPEPVESKAPFRSTLLHVIERRPSVTGSEKRPKGTSKVIESLQEKLASPPRRADPDRLMRMKEVSSVSRMRLLASRSAESTEDTRGLKAQGACGPLNGGDPTQKGGRSDSVPKGVVSWEENRRLTPQSGRKKVDQDFWCPDSYDPSRVERV